MPIVADTHVHLYGCYDLAEALSRGARNLRALRAADGDAASCTYVLFLTEVQGSHVFRDLWEGDMPSPERSFTVKPCEENGAVLLSSKELGDLYLVAGRQIITNERLEVLALASDVDVPDGHPIERAIKLVRQQGGVPVLSWAPGKWFFQRGRIVSNVIERAAPGKLLLADSSLRPTLWGEPQLLGLGRKRGLKILAGSDPLPFPSEEKFIGTYGIVSDAAFDPHRPVSSLRAMLTGEGAIHVAGRRPAPQTVFLRLKKNRDVKKGQAS